MVPIGRDWTLRILSKYFGTTKDEFVFAAKAKEKAEEFIKNYL